MLCYMVQSRTNTHTVHGRPTAKKEIRRFRYGLVRERKVNRFIHFFSLNLTFSNFGLVVLLII